LLRHWEHRADQCHRETCLFQFFAHHSAAATAGPSGSNEKHSFNTILLQIGGDFLAHTAHHCG
jgi:hypothetical protein